MNRRRACAALGAAAAGALLPGCGRGTPGATGARQALLIGGAASMQALLEALAAGYLAARPAPATPSVLVEPGGSLPAFIAASRGAIDVAAMTRALTDAEDGAGARHYLIARGAIGVVVHPSLPLRDLAPAQVRALLAGEIGNWRALGGPDRPVAVHAPARLEGEALLLDGGEFAVNARTCPDSAALLAAVRNDPGAIGCLDGCLDGGGHAAAALAIGGVAATPATVLSGRYPYTRSLYLLLHGDPGGAGAAFVRFARAAAGQAIVRRHGLAAVC